MGAMVMRLALLASIAWVVKLTNPLFTVLGQGDFVSRPDLAARWAIPYLESQ